MDLWVAFLSLVAALIGAAAVGLITSADNLRASRRELYGRFLAASYDHIAAMDRQAASRLAGATDPGLGSSEELARLVRVIELVGPGGVHAAAEELYRYLVSLDAKLGADQTYPQYLEDVWATQQQERDALLERFRALAKPASRSISDDVRQWLRRLMHRLRRLVGR